MTARDAEVPHGGETRRADDHRLVTVVIATYDRPALLRRALLSLAAQTYRPLEAIVVDDGSAERAETNVADFARITDLSVRCVYKENGGAASARNMGVRLASGEFIAFLDDDDEWLAGAAEAMVATLVRSGADFVYSPSVEMTEGASEWVSLPVSAGRPEDLAVEHFLQTNVRSGALMYRRHVFEAGRGFNESARHNEDSDFVQKVAIDFTAAYLDEPTVRVHTHAGSKSKDRVAVHLALLESATSVLESRPGFARLIGPLADTRLAELRGQLIEEQILAGDPAGAKATAAKGPFTLRLADRFALGVGVAWPSLADRAARRATRRGMSIARAVARRLGLRRSGNR